LILNRNSFLPDLDCPKWRKPGATNTGPSVGQAVRNWFGVHGQGHPNAGSFPHLVPLVKRRTLE
jgi:hypothetical protein